MGGSIFQAVEPPNDKCRTYVKVLKFLAFMELFVIVSGFATEQYNTAIFGIIFLSLAVWSWRTIERGPIMVYMYCTVVVYIDSLMSFLAKVQNGGNVCRPGQICGEFALQIIYFVYYFVASIVSFYIYREFKGVAYDKDPSLSRFFEENQPREPEQYNAQEMGNFAPTYGDQGARENPPQPQSTLDKQFAIEG